MSGPRRPPFWLQAALLIASGIDLVLPHPLTRGLRVGFVVFYAAMGAYLLRLQAADRHWLIQLAWVVGLVTYAWLAWVENPIAFDVMVIGLISIPLWIGWHVWQERRTHQAH